MSSKYHNSVKKRLTITSTDDHRAYVQAVARGSGHPSLFDHDELLDKLEQFVRIERLSDHLSAEGSRGAGIVRTGSATRAADRANLAVFFSGRKSLGVPSDPT